MSDIRNYCTPPVKYRCGHPKLLQSGPISSLLQANAWSVGLSAIYLYTFLYCLLYDPP